MAELAMDIVFVDYIDAIRRGDIDAVAKRLDPAVSYQGVAEHLICRNRDEVLDIVRGQIENRPRITRMELADAGDRALLYVEGPDFTEIGGVPLEGNLSIVFTVRDGRIVEMHDYRDRGSALAAAGLDH